MDSRGLTLPLFVLAFTFVERCNGQTTPPAGTAPAGSAPAGSAPAGSAPAGTKPAKWEFEYTTLKKGKLCIAGNPDSITHCASLKEEITTSFHKDKNLTSVEGGKCLYLSDGPASQTTPAGTETTTAGTTTATNETTPAGEVTTPAAGATTPSGGAPQGPVRCVYKAKYTNADKVEAVRLHFYNNEKDPKGKGDVVLLVGYWGDATQPQNLIETPFTA